MAKKSKQQKASFDWSIFFLKCIIFLVPIIVLFKMVKVSSLGLPETLAKRDEADFFSYYKMVALVVFSSVLLLLTVVKLSKKPALSRIQKFGLIGGGVFILQTIASVAMAKYPIMAMVGTFGRFEGGITQICYIVIFTAALLLAGNYVGYRDITFPLALSAIYIGVIGVTQLIGADFYQSLFGRTVITLFSGLDPHKVSFTLGDNAVYSTLFHYNYVGSYMALVLPVMGFSAYFEEEKNRKIIYTVATVLSVIIIFGCQARSGYIGLILTMFMSIFLFGKKLLEYKKFLLIGVGILVLGGVFINFGLGAQGGNRAAVMFKQLTSLVTGRESVNYSVKDFSMKDDSTIRFEDGAGVAFTFVAADNGVKVLNGSGGLVLDATPQTTVYKGVSEGYSLEALNDNGNYILQFSNEKFKIYIGGSKGSAYYINDYGNPDKLQNADYVGFKGNEDFATARGYIWSRTIPMVAKSPLVGYGPDNYSFVFPQNDISGKITAYGTSQMIVDKPHSLYLNIATNSGVIALLAFLVLVLVFLIKSFKVIWRLGFDVEEKQSLVGVTLGIIGYMGAGFFNDSVVSVAPVFWILLGYGYAILSEKRVKEQMESLEG